MKTSASVIGTVAGVVLAPISTGNAAKAWAGVAGATNALQTNMGEVFSSTVAIKRMGSVRQAVKAGEDKYFSKTDQPNDQVAISIAMSNDCWSAASNADAALVKALASGNGDADTSALTKQVETAKKYADEAKAAAAKAQKSLQELDQ
ncbi:hypothetical protein CTTA_4948 [Comamonas testosteroni]|uniref:Uncharacterized protein n=1 Tax=Comamonas testosteroni TaxID=285 RepID=A0A5A7MJR1_COMTE|nr:hypothetical protein [Comamonas testosteroni]GEQ77943.1 hypothetical protein CTTA_4948 [Comamonas testosteroni]